jgi:anti-sigma factor (TIGR02949 family)
MITLAHAYRVMSDAESARFECRRVRGMLDSFASGELGAVDDAFLRAHLDTCEDCSLAHEATSRMRDQLRRAARRDVAPDSLRAAILKRVRGE